MAILTLSDYKTYAGISDTSDDTRLQKLIDYATSLLRVACGRNRSNGFENATRTEDYVSSTGTIQLKEWPVTSITSVTPIDDTNTLGTALDSSEYRLDSETGILTLNGADNGRMSYQRTSANTSARFPASGWQWSPQFGRVRVVYVSTAHSDALHWVLCRMVDASYASIGRDPAVASQSLGSWSVAYGAADDALKNMAALIAPYKTTGVR